MTNTITASAPGSTFLLGEHGVLAGYNAVLAALDCRISVQLTPRSDSQVLISSALGNYQGLLTDFDPNASPAYQKIPALKFVLSAIAQLQNQPGLKLKQGFDLVIIADFSATIGFGSSAAVTVATIAALLQYSGEKPEQNTVFQLAYAAVRQVQNHLGSGADIAASISGGLVRYRMPQPDRPAEIETIQVATHKVSDWHLNLVYAGYKTPTPEVIQKVQQKFANNRSYLQALYHKIGDCSAQGVAALQSGDRQALASAFKAQQALMVLLGVNDERLQSIIDCVEQQTAVLAAKISGSGLGDCVLALTSPEAQTTVRLSNELLQQGVQIFTVTISPKGLEVVVQ